MIEEITHNGKEGVFIPKEVYNSLNDKDDELYERLDNLEEKIGELL